MYSRITDQISHIEESIKGNDLELPIKSTPINCTKDLSEVEISLTSNNVIINTTSKDNTNSILTIDYDYILNNKIKCSTPSNYDVTPSNTLDNFFTTSGINDNKIPNIENQVFDSSIGKFIPKNDNYKLNTTTPIVYHKKKSNLRDRDEILINHFINNSTYILEQNSIALIRINNNYKVLSCKSSNEFELIKKLHSLMYSNKKHFNLEYEMINDVNIGYLEYELDDYGFIKYDDIQDDLKIIGENIKKLTDAKKALGCTIKNTKDNKTIINVTPSFQTIMSSYTNEIEGINISNKHFCSEDYASIDPTFDTKRTMEIWYNHMFMNGFITEWEASLKHYNIDNKSVKLLGYFNEISIFKNIEIDGVVIQELENLFNTELFNDKTQFQEKVDMILTSNNKVCPNLLKIKQYILDNYNLDNDVEHRIQFTTLLNEIYKGLNVSNEYYEMLKKSLPLVLVELNLNKKRYSSGFFWYGLVKKNKNNTEPSNFISNITVIGKKLDDYPLFPVKTKDKEPNKLEQSYKDIVASRGYAN